MILPALILVITCPLWAGHQAPVINNVNNETLMCCVRFKLFDQVYKYLDKLNISDLVGLEARLSAPVLAKCSLLPSPGLLRDT